MTRSADSFLLLLRGATLLLLAVVTSARAQDEDDPPENAAPRQAVQQFTDETVEQWIFNNGGNSNAAQTRKKIETLLTLRVEDLDRCCGLSDEQKKKLLLAGRVDMLRFFERVSQIKKKFAAVKQDQQQINNIFQEIQPLQMTLQSGLFGDSSFLHKAICKTLNAEQTARYDEVELERRTFRYHAKVGLVVAMLENGLPLRDDQRQRVLKLLREETPPPRKFGQYDYYYVMWQFSHLPEAKLKPIFEAAQWKTLGLQFQQVRGMEQFLKQNEMLPEPVVGEVKILKPAIQAIELP